MTNKERVMNNARDFYNTTGVSIDDFTAQCKHQYEISKDYVSNVRDLLQVDYELFKNIKTGAKQTDEMIGDNTLFNVHSALMARSVSDSPECEFTATIMWVDKVVKNLNMVYEDDAEEDDYKIIKYYKDFFRFLFGVGIIARTGWGNETKRVKFQIVDPRVWLPEPFGDYSNGIYSYTGFEKVMSIGSMKRAGYLNIDKVWNTWYDKGATDLAEKDNRLVGLKDNIQDDIYNKYHEVVYMFTEVDCKDWVRRKAVGVFSGECTIPHSVSLIAPTCPEEKKDPWLIQFPFAFYYWKPEPNNPFGDRPANKIRDVQKTKSLLNNLRVRKAKVELYPMYLYNSKYVKDRKDLNFGFNKFISVNTGQDGVVPLDSIVKPLQREFRADNSLVIDDDLDKQVEASTSIGKIVQGTTQERRESATTNSLQQTNTDVNLSLNSKVNSWGERQFVREWLRGYLENFTSSDGKLVKIDTGLTMVPVSLKKADFLVGLNIKIKITSKKEIEEQKMVEKIAYSQIAPYIIQDQSTPEIQKKLFLRNYAEALGIPKNKIYNYIWTTAQEAIQEQENAIIAEGVFVPVNPDDDDMTHLTILEGLPDSMEKEMHKQLHIQQFISKGTQQQPQAQWADGWQAQMLDSIMSQNASQVSAEMARNSQ